MCPTPFPESMTSNTLEGLPIQALIALAEALAQTCPPVVIESPKDIDGDRNDLLWRAARNSVARDVRSILDCRLAKQADKRQQAQESE